ncbi:TraX family protein [Lachnospiraceae bacterium 45-W7]
MTEQKFGLNGCVLKCIAMVSMLIDHAGAVLYPQYIVLRMIGRLAFPIYCFLLVEGAMHTRDIRKYEIRLLLFALVSEVPFDLAFHGRTWWENQNVFFTLFLGVLAIDLMQEAGNKLSVFLIFVLAAVAAEALHTDYGGAGIVFIVCYYLLYQKKILKQIMFLAENFLLYGLGVQFYASIAVLPMLLYNGKKGPSLKYVFYVFYPLHLLILYLIIQIKYGS